MRLFLDIGQCERSAKREARPGSCLVAAADTANESAQGVMLACVQGVTGRPEPDQAALSATTALSDVYYSAVDAGSPREMLQEGLRAADQAVRLAGERGRAAAVTALVMQGRHWYVGHAGHVRAWRYRDLQLKQLTRDHLLPRPRGGAEITKACGYGDTLEAEYEEGELKEGDILLVTTPGIHDTLAGSAILGVLQSDSTAQQMADTLVQRAMADRVSPYIAVCLARVEKLPADGINTGGSLPIIALPARGSDVDGFTIEKCIRKSRNFRLYRALDRESGDTVALRFPDPKHNESAAAFLREESIGRRIDSPYFLKPVALRAGRRTALYSAIEYRKTENLARRIRRKQGLPLAETLQLGDQLLAALETLHRQGVIHGDTRPHNLLYDKQRRQIYLLGMAVNRRDVSTPNRDDLPSTVRSYRAPELDVDSPATERSDVYSAGATIYRMLTDSYPYGKIQAGTDWKQLDYVPLNRHRDGLPASLDNTLARACAPNPADRYTGIAQFIAALSAVPLAGAATARTSAPTEPGWTAQTRWGLWSAAGLLAALLTYLYFVLR